MVAELPYKLSIVVRNEIKLNEHNFDQNFSTYSYSELLLTPSIEYLIPGRLFDKPFFIGGSQLFSDIFLFNDISNDNIISNSSIFGQISNTHAYDIDLNGDGNNDLVLGDSRTEIFIADASFEGFNTSQILESSISSYSFASCDFDNDGDIDLFIGDGIYLNDGSCIFTKSQFLKFNLSGASAFDYDGDGDLDLVVSNFVNQKMEVYNNDGEGNFTISQTLDNEFYYSYPIDFDNDDDLDLIISDFLNKQISIMENQQGVFSSFQSTTVEMNDSKFAILDLDQDGLVELLFASSSSSVPYLSMSSQGFSEVSSFESEINFANKIFSFDYNDDNRIDLILNNREGQTEIFTSKRLAEIILNRNTYQYSGSQIELEYETVPADLQVKFTFDGSELRPTDAGEYELIGTIDSEEAEGDIAETIFITQAELLVFLKDTSRLYGDPNPEFTIIYSGFRGNDDENSLDNEIIPLTSAGPESNVGAYPIEADSKTDQNYIISISPAFLYIEKAALQLQADNKRIFIDEDLPELTITGIGFKNDDQLDDLREIPSISVDIENTSIAGEYPIRLSGGSDGNYNLELIDGILTIEEVLSVLEDKTVSIFPNPATSEIRFDQNINIYYAEILDSRGKKVTEFSNMNPQSSSLNISTLTKGVYFIKVRDDKGKTRTLKFIKK